MCLEESFSPFYRDALNFRPPRIYAVPHRLSVQVSLSSLRRVRLAPFNIPLYQCAFCSVTAHAQLEKQLSPLK